jgi:hypothetical protein
MESLYVRRYANHPNIHVDGQIKQQVLRKIDHLLSVGFGTDCVENDTSNNFSSPWEQFYLAVA